MPIDTKQLRDYIIVPTLKEIGLYSSSAVNLLLGTCGQESRMGTYLHQLGNGPALGIYQMEPSTHEDIIENYLIYQKDLSHRIFKLLNIDNFKDMQPEMLLYNLKYATIMCRLHYFRVKEKLPPANDIVGLAEYWKKYYNTPLGKGKINEFIENYELHIGEM